MAASVLGLLDLVEHGGFRRHKFDYSAGFPRISLHLQTRSSLGHYGSEKQISISVRCTGVKDGDGRPLTRQRTRQAAGVSPSGTLVLHVIGRTLGYGAAKITFDYVKS